MIIEHIKTACLWVLILSSIGLTFSIWTYQPEYTTLGTSDPVELPEIGEEQSQAEIMLPKSITVHQGTERYWMEPGQERYTSLFNALREISFGQPAAESRANIPSIYSHEQAVEYRFSSPMPAGLMEELFDFELEEDETFSLENVDRIHLSVDSGNEFESDVVARFVSSEDEEVLKAETGLSESAFSALYESEEDALHLAEAIEFGSINRGEYTYLPVDPTGLERFTVTADTDVNGEDFKEFLFNDLSTVLLYRRGEYQDGNRFLSISDEGRIGIMRFEHPSSGEAGESRRSMTADSLNFLNSHGGFTNHFYLDSVTEYFNRERAVYRLAMNEMPVLGGTSDESLYYTKIVERSGDQISRYDRSLFRLEEDSYEGGDAVQLPSLDEVQEFLDNAEGMSEREVTDIRIGYHMDSDTAALIIFSPEWFIEYNNQWRMLGDLKEEEEEDQESGGESEDGLEQS
ncbi:YycH family regulatory protein [Alteribacter natronophilus]|uniref:YycH family regulatory protein n=1 Tax=Alteribacter natronophilus TaxID=2583810 RepID=UPI00110DC0B3|nr:two-component system activity regulator YycH [Alteribacter natronophilus]TMW72031.1 hypothetical protein FGB90_07365 [Alteribacter natronophilus]